MRYALIMFVLILFHSAGFTQPTEKFTIARSKPLDDLEVQIALEQTKGISSAKSPIGYGWFTVTNKSLSVFPLKNEFFCFAEAFDSQGNSLPLRWKYHEFGSRFFELKYPADDQASGAIKKFIRTRPGHATSSESAESLAAAQKSSEGKFFPCAEDLFVLKNPGIYTIRLRFQIYTRKYTGGQNFSFRLERFEPVEFKVTKEKND